MEVDIPFHVLLNKYDGQWSWHAGQREQQTFVVGRESDQRSLKALAQRKFQCKNTQKE
jgi:hypothetical protein